MSKLSIVIETFNATPESKIELKEVLAMLHKQTVPQEDLETIVVLDEQREDLADFVRNTEPSVKVIITPDATYYGMKRHGIKEARGDIISLLDSDCLPCKEWAQEIILTISQGADVVAGRVRFPAGAPFARTFAVFDYGHLRNDSTGQAPCFNVSNAGLKKEIAHRYPFDERLTRFGGGTLLGRQLKSLGYRIVYNPKAAVVHNDKGVKKHLQVRFRTGHEAIKLCRMDTDNVLPDTRFMKYGVFAPLIIAIRRMMVDCQSIVFNRHDLNISWYEIPYFIAVSIVIRTAEVIGGLVSIIKPEYLPRRFGW